MRVIALDRSSDIERVYEADIKSYTDYYEHLKCELFDVVMVSWQGESISIFVDDEGLLKSGNVGGKVEGYPEPLFGNMVICGGVDVEGNTLPLPDKFNVMNIMQHIGEVEYIVS